jgi:hypothetical protein
MSNGAAGQGRVYDLGSRWVNCHGARLFAFPGMQYDTQMIRGYQTGVSTTCIESLPESDRYTGVD